MNATLSRLCAPMVEELMTALNACIGSLLHLWHIVKQPPVSCQLASWLVGWFCEADPGQLWLSLAGSGSLLG